MKWAATEPQQGIFNFSTGDMIVASAQKANQSIRGHNLVKNNLFHTNKLLIF